MSDVFLFIMIVGVLWMLGGLINKGKGTNRSRIRKAGIFAAGGAATAFFVDHLLNQFEFDQDTINQLHQMNFADLHHFVQEQQLMDDMQMNALHEQMANQDLLNQMQLNQMMTDPYITPGIDLVVDESFHGIDHGLGIANPDQFQDASFHDSSLQDNSFQDNSFHDFGGGGGMDF